MELMYSLSDFHILRKEPLEYILPASILAILEKIEKDLGFPERKIEPFVYSPFVVTKIVREKKSWENVRSFKTTKIEKKEGTEKYIQDIRVCLNKISNKNYDVQRDTILTLIRNLESGSAELRTVALSIFDIASSNQFYSEMYAKLYKECMGLFPVFAEILHEYLETYTHGLTELMYVDQNVDYDAYCLYNKKNDVRKAMGVFWIHLMNLSVLDVSQVFTIIDCLFVLAFQYVDEPNRINEIEEITEILFLLVKGISTFRQNLGWTEIYPKFALFSGFKVKEKASLSSRVLFKYMDIMEIIKP